MLLHYLFSFASYHPMTDLRHPALGVAKARRPALSCFMHAAPAFEATFSQVSRAHSHHPITFVAARCNAATMASCWYRSPALLWDPTPWTCWTDMAYDSRRLCMTVRT